MQGSAPTGAMELTGERMVPELSPPPTFWAHFYRYRFAAHYVRNRRVLDIACGEGYGTAALLRAGASSAVGIDISAEACYHARTKYGIDARVGDAQEIPLPDRSIDVIVSFETIEHLSDPSRFLAECVRVLSVNGLLVISSPNRDVYRKYCPENPFHTCELTADEFEALLAMHFPKIDRFLQRPRSTPWLSARLLVAEGSPLRAIRGMGRIVHGLQSVLCPHIIGEVPRTYRQRPEERIRVTDRLLSGLVNPYPVLRHRWWRRQEAYFCLAVASQEI